MDGDLRLGGQFRARFLATEWQGIERVRATNGEQTTLVIEERGMPVDQLADYGSGMQVHVEDLGAHLSGRERCEAQTRWAERLPTYKGLTSAGR